MSKSKTDAAFPPCQLCGVNPASCRSHIIPKQFFRRIRGKAPHLLELHVGGRVDPRHTQSGIKEQGILCVDCDQKLGVFDRYGYDVLPERLVASQIKRLAPDMTVYEIGLVDTSKFKYFLCALLWRASRSSHPLFQFLKIGPYEEKFQKILSGKSNAWLDRIDCVIAHLNPPKYDKILLPPFHNKCEDVNVLQFYLYPWKLLIKLDQRPFSPTFEQMSLKSSAPTYAFLLSTFSRGELRVLADLQKTVRNPR